MVNHVIVVAGGRGTRMKSVTPKQFMELNGIPVLMHTIKKFYDFDPDIDIIVVLPKGQFKKWNDLCDKHNFNIKHKVVAGGKQRYYSVLNGLNAINISGYVAIHDGVRPLVSVHTIKTCFETAYRYNNALPVDSLSDSLRKKKENLSVPVNRNEYVAVQTPQVFNIDQIKEAYKHGFKPDYTDDAMVYENYIGKIHLVTGNKENIKITTPVDFIFAEAIIKQIE